MARAVIIEAALNGPWGRERQPLMPILVEELIEQGVECAKAGASILHLHAYDPLTGRQNDDAETYARVIEGIREKIPDIIVYPTVPLLGSGLSGEAASPALRYAHIEELAGRELLEMAVVDPGSVNFSWSGKAGEPGFVYLNPEDHILRGLEVCAGHGIRPSYAIYEPGFTRAGAMLATRFPKIRTPLYRFMFSDGFAWGFPPRRYALEAHLALLGKVTAGAPWMAAGLCVDIRPLIADTVALGGHVRVGLEDAPFGSERDNAELVDEAARLVATAGASPATPAEARSILAEADGLKPAPSRYP